MEVKDDQNKIRFRVDLLKKKWQFLYELKEYSSLIVATGTIVLAVVTAFHINYTKEMAGETKKLADQTQKMTGETQRLADETKAMSKETQRLANLGITEFKMRAYPAFLIETGDLYLESEKLKQSFKVVNKGEITAQKVTSLVVNYHLNNKGEYIFWNILKAYYKDTEWKTSLNYETKIFGNGGGSLIISKSEFPDNHSLNTLKHALLYLKFKVPYVEGYDFETYGFILKRDLRKSDTDKDYYLWQELDVDFTNKLIEKHLISVKDYQGEKEGMRMVKNFLKDYPGYETN